MPDGTKIAEALDYSLNAWKALTQHLGNGAVPIDNNLIDRQIRPLEAWVDPSPSPYTKIDSIASRCDDDRVRTAIDLPDDLHQAVTSIAAHSRRSMNQSVADLIRRGLAPRFGAADAAAPASFKLDEGTALPTIRSPRAVTASDVQALEDE